MKEICRNKLLPSPVQELFKEKDNAYNLRNDAYWEIPKVNTMNNGLESIRYRSPTTWELLPDHIKEANTLQEFKAKIRQWKPQGCTCRICKEYIHSVGFIAYKVVYNLSFKCCLPVRPSVLSVCPLVYVFNALVGFY